MLTAKGDSHDVVLGLEAGADDYMVKPFKNSELVARLKVRLRRTPAEPSNSLRIGDITIDQVAHSLTRDGRTIPLTRLEFDLLNAGVEILHSKADAVEAKFSQMHQTFFVDRPGIDFDGEFRLGGEDELLTKGDHELVQIVVIDVSG